MKLSFIKYAFIGFLVGITLGGYFGWKQKSLVIDAGQKEELVQVRVEDAKAVDEAYKSDAKLEAGKGKIRTEIKYITKEIIKYVPNTVIQSQESNTNNLACPATTLNFGAVGLLNSARTGEDFHPVEWSDAEIEAHTEIGLQELSVADAELAAQYRELALNHDTLVDEVAAYRAEQLKRLNK
jgi:hypothetical protein